jgi:hypothetical protein
MGRRPMRRAVPIENEPENVRSLSRSLYGRVLFQF